MKLKKPYSRLMRWVLPGLGSADAGKIVGLAAALALGLADSALADNAGSGGTITYTDPSGLNPVSSPPYIGGYVVHTFTVNDNLVLPSSVNADVLVVGGGGGAGGRFGDGGGAGGLIYTNISLSGGSYPATIGAGGAASSSYTHGANGGNSVFGTLTALGGGGGGCGWTGGGSSVAGADGGSGGGGGGYTAAPGGAATQPSSASGGFGHAGFGGSTSMYAGGGGAGAAATDSAGGDGLQFTISGVNTYYAGGGGGLTAGGGTGLGGQGGGGAGGTSNLAGGNGAANTGGGGGGGWNATSGSGGSGIVIVRYHYVANPPLAVLMTTPADGQSLWTGVPSSTSALVAGGQTPYTVTYHYKSTTNASYTATAAVAGDGTGNFAQTLGALPPGTYQIYATVVDSTTTTATSATNTFTVSETTAIPVQDGSFETPDDPNATTWSAINATAWYSDYADIYQQSSVAGFFSQPCPGGEYWSALIDTQNTVSIIQDLQTSVNVGDTISMTFYGGRSKAGTVTVAGGVFNAAFMVGGTPYTMQVDATILPVDSWQSYTLTRTITNSGNLAIQFSGVSGNPWLDNISVNLTRSSTLAAMLISPTAGQATPFGTPVSAASVAAGGTGPYTMTYHYKLTKDANYTATAAVADDGTGYFAQTLGALPIGSYQIYATVADGTGHTATSVTNTFTVTYTATVTSPTDGQSCWMWTPISVTASVVGGVEPYTMTCHYKLATNASYTATGAIADDGMGNFAQTLGTLPLGTYQIYATVVDGMGRTTTSVTNTFTVSETTSIPVQDASFETPGALSSSSWWAHIASVWNPGNVIEWQQNSLSLSPQVAGTLQFTNPCPGGGDWYALLDGNTVSITQDLQTTVNAGDTLSMTFYGGRSLAVNTSSGGVFNAAFLVGLTSYGMPVDTTGLALGTWQSFTLTQTITNSGALNIQFSAVSGHPWLDNISVKLTRRSSLGATVTSPTVGQTSIYGAPVSATTVVVNGQAPYTVTYHYKLTTDANYMAAAAVGPFDSTSDFAKTLTGLSVGDYQIYATVADGTGYTANSATNVFTVGLTESIPVQDGSFETPGVLSAGSHGWAHIADVWNPGNVIEWQQNSLSLSPQDANLHFTKTCPGGGDWYALINGNTVSISQDLQTTVNAGDTLSMTFYGGRGKSASTSAGGVFNATFLVGSTSYSMPVDTTVLANDSWQSFTLNRTITNSGQLSIQFAAVSGDPWLDNISVTRTIPDPRVTLPANFTGITVSGTTLKLTAKGGAPNGSWTLLQSTNVTLPLNQWTTNCTGNYDGSGNLLTNIVNTVTNSQKFFKLK